MNDLEFMGTFWLKNVKILIFWPKPFLKKTFYPDTRNNFHLIFVMLQINYTNHFLNLAENVFFMQFKKVKFPQISINFSKTL